jgi:ABC-type Zn uptake system ZnuABC Zn-binding protein ZnuA
MKAIIRTVALASGLSALMLATPPTAAAQLRVVTTTSDLRDIAQAVGGNRITATNISQGYQDPHFVEAKPSFVLQLRRADVVALVGLDLEIGWLPLLIDGARNAKIRPGGSGYLDVSRAISVLDVPRGNVDRSQGDVHPLGNPHYWLDPDNARRIARLFRVKFSELDPAGAATFVANERAFGARISAAAQRWAPDLTKIRGKPIVAWHTSWKYLADYTGVTIVGFMEPKPGVPPSAAHLAGLINTMRRTGARVIIMEPFYDRRTADFVASKTGARVLVLPPSVNAIRGVDDYVQVMEYDIRTLAAAL